MVTMDPCQIPVLSGLVKFYNETIIFLKKFKEYFGSTTYFPCYFAGGPEDHIPIFSSFPQPMYALRFPFSLPVMSPLEQLEIIEP